MLVRRVLYVLAGGNMSTIDKLLVRRRSCLRIEKAFLATVAIIAASVVQLAW